MPARKFPHLHHGFSVKSPFSLLPSPFSVVWKRSKSGLGRCNVASCINVQHTGLSLFAHVSFPLIDFGQFFLHFFLFTLAAWQWDRSMELMGGRLSLHLPACLPPLPTPPGVVCVCVVYMGTTHLSFFHFFQLKHIFHSISNGCMTWADFPPCTGDVLLGRFLPHTTPIISCHVVLCVCPFS